MPAPQQTNWWSRNGKWSMTVGFLALLALLGAAFLAVFSVVKTSIKSSDVYEQALQAAVTNAVLIERLGAPIRPGYLVTGRISKAAATTAGGTGHAHLRIPLRGPKAKATLIVEADQHGEVWTLRAMEARMRDEEFNLLTNASAGGR